MAAISRKELKQDRFVEEVGQSVLFVSSHRRQLLFGGGAVLLLIVSVAVWIGHRETIRVEANSVLKKGIEMYHGKVDTEQVYGAIQFPTTIARFRDTREQFSKVIAEYPDCEAAVAAVYYMALLDVEQDNFDEAQRRLGKLLENSDSEYMAIARLFLASLYAQQDKYRQASEQYEHLIEYPTRLVSKRRSKLAWARVSVEHDPEMARTLIEELQDDSDLISGEAKALLVALEPS